ncbi:hypothetical protein SteCoe_24280 [Stentor coeruleus]|uniref:Uncharacterized protein n=1 Tax=Stentor coeruleus TaxID=5963 RepID=A0A1R2BI09_9CILI|nr:hypothetical protein SteCoe_24280 [Stentor coeruleus]
MMTSRAISQERNPSDRREYYLSRDYTNRLNKKLKGVFQVDMHLIHSLEQSKRQIRKKIVSAHKFIKNAVLSANEIAPGIPMFMVPNVLTTKTMSSKSSTRRCISSSPTSRINFITFNKQALNKLHSKCLLPVKDNDWMKVIRSPPSTVVTHQNWGKIRNTPLTPDTVDVRKIVDQIHISPVHSKCESCCINKHPLKLCNPRLKKLGGF